MFKRFITYCTAVACIVTMLLSGCATSGNAPVTADREPPKVEKAEGQPKNAEFILGVGDSLDIFVYRQDSMKTSTKINPSGMIMLPLIGDVEAAGKSITALRADITQRLAKYFVDPQVTISVSSMQSQRVLVIGEVKNPGVFALDTDFTVIDAVAKAGGWTNDARTDAVVLLRSSAGKVDTQALDIEAALKTGRLAENKMLQRNDIVFVPTKKIADIARFMTYLANILSPIVMAEGGIVLWPQMIDALQGKTSSGAVAIPTR